MCISDWSSDVCSSDLHLIVAAHASFTALLHWLPLVLLVAVAATVGWFRLRDPAGRVAAFPEPPGLAGGNLASGAAPLVFLALAMCWVGLLCAGVPYPVFWWVAVLAMFGAWIRTLRCGQRGPPAPPTGHTPNTICACLFGAAL